MSSNTGGHAKLTCNWCGHEAHEPGRCSHWSDWKQITPDPDNLSDNSQRRERCPCGFICSKCGHEDHPGNVCGRRLKVVIEGDLYDAGSVCSCGIIDSLNEIDKILRDDRILNRLK